MLQMLARACRDETGTTAVEYGLIAALVSVAAIGALQALGTSLDAIFSTASASLDTAAASAAGAP